MSKIIEITEVGPRDGFQNVNSSIPTDVKQKVIAQLIDAGAKKIEITSMVSPKAIPQLADASKIIEYVLTGYPNITPFVLVPNTKGASLVYEKGIRHITYVISVSPAHNKANINRTHEESLQDLKNITQLYPDLNVVVALATAFGCPFVGAIDMQTMVSIIRTSISYGVKAVTLCDTIGVANPVQTKNVIQYIQDMFPNLDIGIHMHNTHGMALTNMLTGLEMNIRRFETALGGLGGCPFAPGAAGNAATEDAVNMFQRMGYETGYDLDKLLIAVQTVKTEIEPNLLSCLSKARTYGEFDFYKL